MATVRPDALIIGAGVSGLTTAVRLAERGLTVHIVSKELTACTTSANAGAIWDPIYATHEAVPRWSAETYEVLSELAGAPGTGVRMVSGVEASRTVIPAPAWARQLPGFRECRADELREPFVSGWRYTAPIVDMPVYLDHLLRRLTSMGVTLAEGAVSSLDEVTGLADVVVNCTGIGARELLGDQSVTPVRGQLVAMTNPGITEFFAEHTAELTEEPDITYILPQGPDVVLLGGSAEDRVDSLILDKTVADGIVERCVAVEPALAGAEVLGHRIGLRPHREPVRVEREERDGATVVHNYGHGGAGVSLSWGCASDVARLVAAP
ncbi:FAD-dependent oxidoreductase [Actinoplanes sp. NPDC049316]|uniref:FAD-dependent oxidoreductase n=1 Tax=Actinoplanes sp. NPDC049316 TaxID=3154727 RepID=UPI00342DE837